MQNAAKQENLASLTSVQLTGVNVRQDEDPRIKSPDDILSKLSPKKSPNPLGLPPRNEERPSDAARELAELRAKHEQEISQWRDYERRIQEWRAQVVAIVDGLRRDAATQTATLKAQEQELQALRKARANIKAAG